MLCAEKHTEKFKKNFYDDFHATFFLIKKEAKSLKFQRSKPLLCSSTVKLEILISQILYTFQVFFLYFPLLSPKISSKVGFGAFLVTSSVSSFASSSSFTGASESCFFISLIFFLLFPDTDMNTMRSRSREFDS